jgi:hypothetical protein
MKINLSFLSLLTLLFVGLKLTNHIDWSWWWVLSPTLFSLGVGFLILLTFFLVGLLGGKVVIYKKK